MSAVVPENKGVAPSKIIRCPSCLGTGAVLCSPDSSNPSCISIPRRVEEKCLCCYGRGWIIAEHANDPFCAKMGP